MKTYPKTLIAFLLIFSIFGCVKNDENPVNTDSIITYSESPFDLQGANVKFAKDISYDNKERTRFDIWLPDADACKKKNYT